MSINHCDFCDEFSGGRENAFARIYSHDQMSRILFHSENFVVFPSLGQIVEGYLLLAPTSHWKALADMPDPIFHEFAALCKSVRGILEGEYGSCIFFEHGTRRADSGGCGIYHAHLHAVPFPDSSEPSHALRSKFPYKELADPKEMKKQTEGLSAYLYYENSQARPYVFDVGILPSQYMRRLLAQALGKNAWDWRAAGEEEALLATLSRLSNHAELLRVAAGVQELTSDDALR